MEETKACQGAQLTSQIDLLQLTLMGSYSIIFFVITCCQTQTQLYVYKLDHIMQILRDMLTLSPQKHIHIMPRNKQLLQLFLLIKVPYNNCPTIQQSCYHEQKYRLLDSLVVQCWLRVREVPGSIPSQGPPPRQPSGRVLASSAGGSGGTIPNQGPDQRRYKNGTSSSLVQH